MAIPQGRLSTEVVEHKFVPPDERTFYALISYELGPVAVGDTSLGLLYQTWRVDWDGITGDVILTPETVGDPVIALMVEGLLYITFTFDTSGRISFAYTTTTSSYLYWYDSSLGMTVTTDLGSNVVTPSISLDDKRTTQNTANDMILWYTKDTGSTWTLYQRLQRDRFSVEYEMATGLLGGNLMNVGMAEGLRVQIGYTSRELTSVPPVPLDTTLTPQESYLILLEATSFLDLTLLPNYTFEEVFGQSVDGADLAQAVTSGIIFTFNATREMKFTLAASSIYSSAIIMIGTIAGAGNVTNRIHWTGGALTEYLTIPDGTPSWIAIGSSAFTTNAIKADFITNLAPYTPRNPLPVSTQSPTAAQPVTLAWDGDDPNGDAVTYDVYFDKDDPTPTTKIGDAISDEHLVLGTLLDDSSYYWKVISKDPFSLTTEGPVWHFKTEAVATEPPASPVNTVSFASIFGGEIGSFLSSDPFHVIPDAGVAIFFTMPFTTKRIKLQFSTIEVTAPGLPLTSRTGAVNTTAGDFTTPPTYTWGLGGGISCYLNPEPGDVYGPYRIEVTQGQSLIFNVKNNSPTDPNWVHLYCTYREIR